MSELPPGSVNIEDESPQPPAPPVETPPAAPPVAAAPPETPPDDGTVDVNGERMVPVAAVVAERRQRQSLAQQVEQLQQQIAAQAPLVAVLQANPQLLQPQPPQPPQPPAPPPVDPDAEETARLMDFYTSEGKPDVDRATKYLALQDRRAGRQAQQAVQPLAQTTARERSEFNFQRALRVATPDGKTPNPKVLREIWNTFDPAETADDRVAGVLAVQAIGAGTFMQQAPAPPAAPPLVSEPSGGRTGPTAPISALEQRVLANTGKTQADWQKQTANFQAGRPNVLED